MTPCAWLVCVCVPVALVVALRAAPCSAASQPQHVRTSDGLRPDARPAREPQPAVAAAAHRAHSRQDGSHADGGVTVFATCAMVHFHANGSAQYSDAQNDGSLLTFRCDDGYAFRTAVPQFMCMGGMWMTNDANMRMLDVSSVECVQVCPAVAPVVHGMVMTSDAQFDGSVAMISCDAGFMKMPHNATQLLCSGGVWQGTRPECMNATAAGHNDTASTTTPAACALLAAPANGHVMYSPPLNKSAGIFLPAPGTAAVVMCGSGYQLATMSMAMARVCAADGQWSANPSGNTPPTCVPSSSGMVMDMSGGGGMGMDMTLHWGGRDANPLLLPQWPIDTHGKFAAGAIGVLVAAVIKEYFCTLFRLREASWRSQHARIRKSDHAVCSAELVAAHRARMFNALFFGALNIFSTLLMLVAMTYNVVLILMLAAGAALGYYFFPPELMQAEPATLKDTHDAKHTETDHDSVVAQSPCCGGADQTPAQAPLSPSGRTGAALSSTVSENGQPGGVSTPVAAAAVTGGSGRCGDLLSTASVSVAMTPLATRPPSDVESPSARTGTVSAAQQQAHTSTQAPACGDLARSALTFSCQCS